VEQEVLVGKEIFEYRKLRPAELVFETGVFYDIRYRGVVITVRVVKSYGDKLDVGKI
jgi:hypothetical protein